MKKVFLFLGIFLLASVGIVYAQTYGTIVNTTTNVGNPPNVAAVLQLARQYIKNGIYIWDTPSRNWSSHQPNTDSAPKTFDCSGFAGWVWWWATNGRVNMHGQTDEDWHDNSGKYIKHLGKDGLQPGDLVYFGSTSSVHHVGIFEGNGACGKTDCFLEYYSFLRPGRSNSLSNEPDFVGYLRPVIQ